MACIMRLRRHITYANVMSTLAVTLLLAGGTAYAARQVIDGATIQRGSVKAPQLAANSVDSTKVRNGSLLAADFKRGQLPAGKVGPRGPAGPAGSPDTSQFYDKVASDARFATKDPQVVHVTGSGTPTANGNALIAAVAAAGTPADAEHPEIIVLGPGTFDLGTQTLTMTDGVNIAGAGLTATTIRGTADQLIIGASAELSDVAVQHNMGSGGPYTTISISGGDQMRFTRATMQTSSSGGGTRTGILATGASYFIAREARLGVQGGTTDTTISTTNSTADIADSSIYALGSGTTVGIFSQTGGGAILYATRLRALTGSTRYAVQAGATASIMQIGASEVYGTLAPSHTYYCGATYESVSYTMLPADCIV